MRILSVIVILAQAATGFVLEKSVHDGDGTDVSPFKTEFSVSAGEKVLVKLPTLTPNRAYTLQLDVSCTGTDRSTYEVKTTCGCLKPRVVSGDSQGVLLTIGIDLTNRSDKMQQTVYLFDRDRILSEITVKADILTSHVKFDRSLLVMNTSVPEEKGVYIHFDPTREAIRDVRTRNNHIRIKNVRKEANRQFVLLQNRPPIQKNQEDELVIETETDNYRSIQTLPVRFADVSLGVSHPPVLVLGNGRVHDTLRALLHIEREWDVEATLVRDDGLEIEETSGNYNWLVYSISLSPSIKGTYRKEIVFDLSRKGTDRHEELTIPVLASVK